MATPFRMMTQPQEALHYQIGRRLNAVRRLARRSAKRLRKAIDRGLRLDAVNARHPEWVQADMRTRVFYWLCLLLLAVSIPLDAVLTSSVAEYALVTFSRLSAQSADIGRFLLPVGVLCIELGFGMMSYRSWKARNWVSGLLWSGLCLVPLVVIPVLVGETMHVDATNRAASQGLPVSTLGLFDGPIPTLTLAMMAFTAMVHGWVVFGPHYEAVSYARWSIGAFCLRVGKWWAQEGARRDGNAAGDEWQQYVTNRDEYVGTYPDWSLGTPNLSECQDVLAAVFGQTPNSTPGAAQPAPPPVPPSPAAAGPAAADGQDEEQLLRDLLDRRARQRDAEVTA